LGSGQSVVKKAKDKHTQKEYAMKCISKKNAAISKTNVDHEIELLRNLIHPNIVNFSESLEDPETFFLVMEFVPGSDLYDVIKTLGTIRPNIAGAILRQIISAVSYLHSRGIVHHDIKPENVIVDYSADQVKLTDFGSAIEVKKISRFRGTVNFMAPEILQNMSAPHRIDHSVDIWSIGVVAYIMLCGFNPFDYKPKKNHHIINRIIAGKYDFPSPYWNGIPTHCKEFIRKCLVVNPKRRATAAELLKHPWIISTSEHVPGNMFTKEDREKLESGQNFRHSSGENSLKSLMELFGNCPSRS